MTHMHNDERTERSPENTPLELTSYYIEYWEAIKDDLLFQNDFDFMARQRLEKANSELIVFKSLSQTESKESDCDGKPEEIIEKLQTAVASSNSNSTLSITEETIHTARKLSSLVSNLLSREDYNLQINRSDTIRQIDDFLESMPAYSNYKKEYPIETMNGYIKDWEVIKTLLKTSDEAIAFCRLMDANGPTFKLRPLVSLDALQKLGGFTHDGKPDEVVAARLKEVNDSNGKYTRSITEETVIAARELHKAVSDFLRRVAPMKPFTEERLEEPGELVVVMIEKFLKSIPSYNDE